VQKCKHKNFLHQVHCIYWLTDWGAAVQLVEKEPSERPIMDIFTDELPVDSSWNVMTHGDAPEGKCWGNWRMEWVASTLHTTSEHGVSNITITPMRTPRLPLVDWTDAPADLNGLVRFAERWNMVSVRVPSHFKRSLLPVMGRGFCTAARGLSTAIATSM
jgi:hypothetical protein